jgi:predicted RNA-binding protein with PUA-like domain
VANTKRSYWLMKSEPDVYSVDHLARETVGTWEGVRNYQARNHMRAMHKGDLAFFYHSSTEPPGIVGVMEIEREAYVDPTQFDVKSPYYDEKSKPEAPRWDRVDVRFVEKLAAQITLAELREDPVCAEMLVIRRGMRLSVQPVDKAHFAHLLKRGKARSRP